MRVSLDDALDDCIQRLDTEGVAGCLARYPDLRQDLAPLLAVAGRLRAVTPPPMRPAARAALKERLLLAPLPPAVVVRPRRRWLLPVPPRLAAWRPPVWGVRTAVALTLVLALLVGTWSAAAASGPGDTLYAGKLAQEEVGLWFVSGSANLATANFTLADRRSAEVEGLAATKRLAVAAPTLTNFRDHLARGLAAFALSLPSERESLSVELKEVSDRAVAALHGVTTALAGDDELAAVLSPSIQPVLTEVEKAQEQAASPTTTGALTPGPTLSATPTATPAGLGSAPVLSPTGETRTPTSPASPTATVPPTWTAAATLPPPSETPLTSSTGIATATATATPTVNEPPAVSPTLTVPASPKPVIIPPTVTISRPIRSPTPPARRVTATPRPPAPATRTPARTPTLALALPPHTATPVPPASTPSPVVIETPVPLPPAPTFTPIPPPPPLPTVALAPTVTPEEGSGAGKGNGKGNNGNGNGNGGGNGSKGNGNGNGNNGNGNGNGGGNGSNGNGGGNGHGGRPTPRP